ncbi:spore protease YyaC [Aceticella autotrophica]|uniref:Spore protease YyaC n=1 Tax=Aceticella autotrophica TaxID=2755338 RepID=A0A975AUV2_9THEO|nr:spore protease YyaC [Aceticella autotrophica]QSZ26871.1 spore protease YyaC [Aceticella autotrophica]
MDELRIKYNDKDAINVLSEYLCEFINQNSVILCIGTDKCISDSLGPIVGNMLTKMIKGPYVYGTLKKPVHAKNLADNINFIRKNYTYSNIIAIDACLGDEKSIGKISVKKSPLYPGKGIGKKIPPVGDISIIGIIDVYDMIPPYNTRLGFVFEMAEVIALSLQKALFLTAPHL